MATREVKQRVVKVSSHVSPQESDQTQHRLVYQYHVRIIDPDSKQEHVYDRELAIKQQVEEVPRQKNTDSIPVDSPLPTPQVTLVAATSETFNINAEPAPPVTEDFLQQAVAESESIPSLTTADLNEQVTDTAIDKSTLTDKPIVETFQAETISEDNAKFNAGDIDLSETPPEITSSILTEQKSIAKFIDIELPDKQDSTVFRKLRVLGRLFHRPSIRRSGLILNTGRKKLLTYHKQFLHFISPGRLYQRFKPRSPHLSLNTGKQKLSIYRKQLSRLCLQQRKNKAQPTKPTPDRGDRFLFMSKRVVLFSGIALLLLVLVAAFVFLLPTVQDENPPDKTTSAVNKPEPAPAESNQLPPKYQARIERDAQGYTITLESAGRAKLDLKPVTTISVPASNKPANEIIHVVVAGDTLWFIAKRYVHDAMRYPELAHLSNIKNPHRIYPGDRVRIVQKPTLDP